MRILKIFICFTLSIFAMQAFAIQVNVQSSSKKIMGLGFTVNGTKHGGMGNSYQGNDMPNGSYKFGLRANGKDIPCLTKDGKKTIKLNADTNAVLKFTGKRCTLVINN